MFPGSVSPLDFSPSYLARSTCFASELGRGGKHAAVAVASWRFAKADAWWLQVYPEHGSVSPPEDPPFVCVPRLESLGERPWPILVVVDASHVASPLPRRKADAMCASLSARRNQPGSPS